MPMVMLVSMIETEYEARSLFEDCCLITGGWSGVPDGKVSITMNGNSLENEGTGNELGEGRKHLFSPMDWHH